MSPGKIRLGVNIDHVATLRQQRAGLVNYPSILEAAVLAKKGGADLLTIHVRGDRRHIQESDLALLMKENILPVNLEMAATDEMIGIALKYKPFIVCLVPEKREELTTEGGLDVVKYEVEVQKTITQMKRAGIRTSLFIEPSQAQVAMSSQLKAEAVEFHTGKFALAKASDRDLESVRLRDAFMQGHNLGLAVHAGHGLDYENILPLLKFPFLEEVNIGHSIICRSVFVGLESAVRGMKNHLTTS
jgi:pyridoxine 5-phosphate synthase